MSIQRVEVYCIDSEIFKTSAYHARYSYTHTEQVSLRRVSHSEHVMHFDRSLSVILICRFHIILQMRNAHPNTSWSLPPVSVGSFPVATQRIHNAVVAEFGDSMP